MTNEELLKENKRLSLLLKRLSEKTTDMLNVLLDTEAFLKTNGKLLKRVTELIESK